MPKSPKPSAPSFTPHLALRFTDSQIQLAESTSGSQLKSFAAQALPDGAIDNGTIKNPDAVSQALTQLFKSHPPTKTHLTLGIPENSAFIKTLDLPGTKPDEISDTLTWQADHLLPLPPDQMYFDWAQLPHPSSKKTAILLAALPKNITDSYLDIIEPLKLTPLDIETTSLTLIRLAQPLPSDHPLVLIDAEPTLTSLILEPPSTVVITSVTPPQQTNQPDLTQAQKDLTQMISFYNKKSGKTPSAVVLTGQFASHLQSHPLINLPHQLFPAPKSASSDFPAQQVSLALATKPIAPPQDPHSVNLLPQDTQTHFDRAQNQHLIRTLTLITISILTIANLALIYPLFRLTQTSTAPPNPTTNSTSLPPSLDQDLQTRQLNQKLSLANQLLDSRPQLTQAITQLPNFIPQPIVVSSFSLDPVSGKFSLQGFTPTRQSLIELKTQLANHPQLSDIDIPLTALEKSENINFTLSGTFLPQPITPTPAPVKK